MIRILFENIKMPTFESQDTLPFLPLPSLEATLDLYLETVRPFISQEDLPKTLWLIEDFKSKSGPALQQRLEKRFETAKNTFWTPKFITQQVSSSQDILGSDDSLPKSEIAVTKSSWLIVIAFGRENLIS